MMMKINKRCTKKTAVKFKNIWNALPSHLTEIREKKTNFNLRNSAFIIYSTDEMYADKISYKVNL